MTTQSPALRQLTAWLDSQTTRKASCWSEVASVNESPSIDFQRSVLARLPILSVTKDEMPQFPCEDITGGAPAQRFILQVIEQEEMNDKIVAEYYINTEGYEYARYAVRLF